LPSGKATDVEEAAEKAHVDPRAHGQARADLGIVASRSNAGGVQAVQWSLPLLSARDRRAASSSGVYS